MSQRWCTRGLWSIVVPVVVFVVPETFCHFGPDLRLEFVNFDVFEKYGNITVFMEISLFY